MLPITVNKEEDLVRCHIRSVLFKVTGKWQILILLALEDGPSRFGELKRNIGDITQKVLTANLRSLERDGYIKRRIDDGPPIASYYNLTPLGESLIDVFYPLISWSGENFDRVKSNREEYDLK